VKLIKLKRTETVCTEEERNRDRKSEKTERKHTFFPFFPPKRLTPAKNKNKKMPWSRVPGQGCPVTLVTRDPI